MTLNIILIEHDSKFLLIDAMLLEGKTKEKHQALYAFISMAEENCIFSLCRLARIYAHGFKVKIKKDPERAIQYLQKAVILGDSKSMVSLGYFYEHGQNVLQSLETALVHYQNALEHHNPFAYYKMANLCLEYLLKEPDLQKIGEYLKQAIHYEKQEELIHYLNSGPLDDYQPVGEFAAFLLEKINALIEEESHIKPISPLKEASSTIVVKDDTPQEKSSENQWCCQII